MMRFGPMVRFVISIGLPLLVGMLGSTATRTGTGSWYAGLMKPSFNPPGWLFGPAWTVLYILMGIAAGLVWTRGLTAPGVKPALVLFLVQLALNGLWSFIFFAARAPGWAFVEILLMWLAILATTMLFFRVSTAAGWLMIPYIGWVSFAALLNGSIMILNQTR